jgi:hypothetical protein
MGVAARVCLKAVLLFQEMFHAALKTQNILVMLRWKLRNCGEYEFPSRRKCSSKRMSPDASS